MSSLKHVLLMLSFKVHGYLRSSSWETRIAASQAVDAIVKNVPQWDPIGTVKTGMDFIVGLIVFEMLYICGI